MQSEANDAFLEDDQRDQNGKVRDSDRNVALRGSSSDGHRILLSHSQYRFPISRRQAVWKKYQRYELDVDPNQDDKAKEILTCTFARPHMRAFHCSWWSFFIAFFIWFSISPLLSEIREDLGLLPSRQLARVLSKRPTG